MQVNLDFFPYLFLTDKENNVLLDFSYRYDRRSKRVGDAGSPWYAAQPTP